MSSVLKSRRTTSRRHAALLGAQGPIGVRELRQELRMTRKQFARLTAVSERSVAEWEAEQPISAANQKSLRETERLCRALMKVMKPEHVGAWLDGPNDAFSGLKPLELIERGEMDRIWRMVFEIESGALT